VKITTMSGSTEEHHGARLSGTSLLVVRSRYASRLEPYLPAGSDVVKPNCRRLRIRYERLADIHLTFLRVGCALICWNFMVNHEFC